MVWAFRLARLWHLVGRVMQGTRTRGVPWPSLAQLHSIHSYAKVVPLLWTVPQERSFFIETNKVNVVFCYICSFSLASILHVAFLPHY